jgi:para-nitrobenzyl esterase
VVTVNYRLRALGFAYLAELADDLGAGNFVWQDTVCALSWVRQHIAAFGGDPER